MADLGSRSRKRRGRPREPAPWHPGERELISGGFAGVVTWQRIVEHLTLPQETLLDFAPGWQEGTDGRPVRIP